MVGVDPTKDPQITVMMTNPAPRIVSWPRRAGKTRFLNAVRHRETFGWADELGPWISEQLRTRGREEFLAKFGTRTFDYSDYLTDPNETRMRATVLGDWTNPA